MPDPGPAAPPAVTRFVIGPEEVGIACRYKAGPGIKSTDQGGHADAVLPGGEPLGFYARTRRDRCLAIIAPGMVRDAAEQVRRILLRLHRPSPPAAAPPTDRPEPPTSRP